MLKIEIQNVLNKCADLKGCIFLSWGSPEQNNILPAVDCDQSYLS